MTVIYRFGFGDGFGYGDGLDVCFFVSGLSDGFGYGFGDGDVSGDCK